MVSVSSRIFWGIFWAPSVLFPNKVSSLSSKSSSTFLPPPHPASLPFFLNYLSFKKKKELTPDLFLPKVWRKDQRFQRRCPPASTAASAYLQTVQSIHIYTPYLHRVKYCPLWRIHLQREGLCSRILGWMTLASMGQPMFILS